jgi:hypothetical protein
MAPELGFERANPAVKKHLSNFITICRSESFFIAKVVEQRLGTGVLSHHHPQASVNDDEQEHRQNACSYGRCCQHFRSHSLKTFSTATPVTNIYLETRRLIGTIRSCIYTQAEKEAISEDLARRCCSVGHKHGGRRAQFGVSAFAPRKPLQYREDKRAGCADLVWT